MLDNTWLKTLSDRPPIIVIGMHRSGTTLLSHVLAGLGVQMGREQERNREAIAFLRTNDALLRASGAHWARPEPFVQRLSDEAFVEEMAEMAGQTLDENIERFGQVASNQAWGWKDPRTTLTLPVWLKLFPDASVVHIVRNGVDVALSLKRRAWRHFARPRVNDTERMFPAMAFVRGFRLWETYLRCAVEHSASRRQMHQLRYEDLLADPVPEIARMIDSVGLSSNSEDLSGLSERLLSSPSRRSWWEALWVRLLFACKILDTGTLSRFGYDFRNEYDG